MALVILCQLVAAVGWLGFLVSAGLGVYAFVAASAPFSVGGCVAAAAAFLVLVAFGFMGFARFGLRAQQRAISNFFSRLDE